MTIPLKLEETDLYPAQGREADGAVPLIPTALDLSSGRPCVQSFFPVVKEEASLPKPVCCSGESRSHSPSDMTEFRTATCYTLPSWESNACVDLSTAAGFPEILAQQVVRRKLGNRWLPSNEGIEDPLFRRSHSLIWRVLH